MMAPHRALIEVGTRSHLGCRVMRESVETLIVGAGQAGLAVSALLAQQGREHLIVDRRKSLGGAWQDRWDAFRLVSPNWMVGLPAFPYQGNDPDGYMPRDDVVAHLRQFATAIRAPVRLGTAVTRLTQSPDHGAARFRVTTSSGEIDARTVVVAAGPFQVPYIPPLGTSLDPSIKQVHVQSYRSPEALPPGGVLLVGSGQSGVQLAEELLAAGRGVTMAVGRCGRLPRTYRGRDVFWWLRQLAVRGEATGVRLPASADLPDPRARLNCNPQLSGHGEPHDTNLREMAANGLLLAGRLEALEGTTARFANDLRETLTFVDSFFDERFKPKFDAFAERAGLDLPPDSMAQVVFDPIPVPQLDLAARGISTVIWTSGYRPDFTWLQLPVVDEWGLPIQVNGWTDVPGLGFIGTPWLVDMASANLIGLERDAVALVDGWPET